MEESSPEVRRLLAGPEPQWRVEMLSESEKASGAERKELSEPWRHIRCTEGAERKPAQLLCQRAHSLQEAGGTGRPGLRLAGGSEAQTSSGRTARHTCKADP